MATLRTTIVVCDICKDPNKPAQRYYMTLPGVQRRGLDLCADDAAGLEAYRKYVEAAQVGGQRSARRVYTPEEVEGMKHQQDGSVKTRGQ